MVPCLCSAGVYQSPPTASLASAHHEVTIESLTYNSLSFYFYKCGSGYDVVQYTIWHICI